MIDNPVPSQDGSRKLSCLIEGEPIVFAVTAGRDWVVSELKNAIKKERELDTLKNVGPHTLALWKVSAIDESRCDIGLLPHPNRSTSILKFTMRILLATSDSRRLVKASKS